MQVKLKRDELERLCIMEQDWPAEAVQRLHHNTAWYMELTAGDLKGAANRAGAAGCYCSTIEALGASIRFLGLSQA